MREIYSPNVGMDSRNRVSKVRPETKAFAIKLRKKLTPSENLLWQRLRKNTLGVRIRRQQVVWGYVANFYCATKSLVIELDGKFHRGRENEDALRDGRLKKRGIRT